MAATDEAREQAVAAFAEVATDVERAKVAEVDDAVSSVVAAALSIEVRNAQEASDATEFLSRLAGEKRRSETARKFLVDPLRKHVEAINARFKATLAPLEQADGIVREKVLAYRAEQERIRAAEQARLDAEHAERERLAEEERRRQENEARVAREAAARDAARAEAEAAAAERKRQDELTRKASEVEREVAALDDEGLRKAIARTDEVGAAARTEMTRRRAAREAQEAVAAARQREDEARAAEEAARSVPVADVPVAVAAEPERLASASGSISERKRWVAEVVDESRVPRRFLVVDMKAINAAVKAGEREIPGVKIEHQAELAVKAR